MGEEPAWIVTDTDIQKLVTKVLKCEDVWDDENHSLSISEIHVCLLWEFK